MIGTCLNLRGRLRRWHGFILHKLKNGGPVFEEGISRILFPVAVKRQWHSFICRTNGPALQKRRCGTPGTITGEPPGPLFCLAPDWVYPAPSVTLGAVGSYPAISPLPPEAETPGGGIFSVTLAVDRGLCPNLPRFHGESCPMVSGLSSTPRLHETQRMLTPQKPARKFINIKRTNLNKPRNRPRRKA